MDMYQEGNRLFLEGKPYEAYVYYKQLPSNYRALTDRLNKPAYLIHGHVHLRYEKDAPRIHTLGETTVVNACERYALNVPDREFPEKDRNVILWKGKNLLTKG